MKRIMIGCLAGVSAIFFMSCAAMGPPEPTQANFQPPTVSLSHAEVAHYWGWWYFAKKVEPTKGDPGDYGAPLDLAFVFDIENPNEYPVQLESFKFTVAFEEFDLNTVSAMETQWIPPGKTNQVRVHAMFDARQSLLSLMVTGGFKLQEKGVSVWDQLQTWWVEAPEFGFPIHVKEGAAVFSADGVSEVVPFTSTYPE